MQLLRNEHIWENWKSDVSFNEAAGKSWGNPRQRRLLGDFGQRHTLLCVRPLPVAATVTHPVGLNFASGLKGAAG